MKNALAVEPEYASSPVKRSKDDTENRGELSNIYIEMTENGCIVRCSFDALKPPGPKVPYPQDEKYSFDDVDKAGEYVHGMMLRHMEEEGEEEKPKSGKAAKKAGKSNE